MSIQLDPRVSGSRPGTGRQLRPLVSPAYRAQFGDPRPPVPHDEAMARVRAMIEAKRRRAS